MSKNVGNVNKVSEGSLSNR